MLRATLSLAGRCAAAPARRGHAEDLPSSCCMIVAQQACAHHMLQLLLLALCWCLCVADCSVTMLLTRLDSLIEPGFVRTDPSLHQPRCRAIMGEQQQPSGVRGSCTTARLHSNPRGPNPSPSSPMCCPGSLLSILWTCCGHGRSSGRGSTVEGRRARTVQRPEGGHTDTYYYYYARVSCGLPPGYPTNRLA